MKWCQPQKLQIYIFLQLSFLLISDTEGFSPRSKPTLDSNSGNDKTKPKNAKFSSITTPTALLEALFREKFGSSFNSCGNNSAKSNLQTQIFVTSIDTSTKANDEDSSGTIFMDYLDDTITNDNVNIPVIFVILQQTGPDNCTSSAHQNPQSDSAMQNSFSSGFGQQSQSQGKNGYQSQQQSFGNGDQSKGKSMTPLPPIKFNTFAPMNPFSK